MIKVHRFRSTSEAYDLSQCSDEIRMGDVLVVESERVVGFLLSAWPVSVVEAYGAFHFFSPLPPCPNTPSDDRDWWPSFDKAVEVANELGYLTV